MSAQTCDELFRRLLALDHSREDPWGPLHGVAVACYRLQHPTSLAEGPAFLLTLLGRFTSEGLDAALRVTEGARRANSHRGHPEAPPKSQHAPDPPTGFAVTIAEVAWDGTFPAAGHHERVNAWAEATLAAWESHNR